jgi:hypothetical protein
VVGTFDWDSHAVTALSDRLVGVSLPGIANFNLHEYLVNFAPNPKVGDGDPTCTGTVLEPTAPAGKVCLHLHDSSNVTNLSGRSSTVILNRSFTVGFFSEASGDIYLSATWAFTAAA